MVPPAKMSWPLLKEAADTGGGEKSEPLIGPSLGSLQAAEAADAPAE